MSSRGTLKSRQHHLLTVGRAGDASPPSSTLAVFRGMGPNLPAIRVVPGVPAMRWQGAGVVNRRGPERAAGNKERRSSPGGLVEGQGVAGREGGAEAGVAVIWAAVAAQPAL